MQLRRSFLRDKGGSVLLVAAVCFLVLVAVGGAGFDFARRELIRLKLQQASDAAALAGALMPTGTSENDRRNEVLRYYKLNFPATYLNVARPSAPKITVTDSVQVDASVDVPTSFIGNLGLRTIPAKNHSLVTIGDKQVDLDVVLVVDESASNIGTCSDCANMPRIIKLRNAASTLVDTILDGTKNPNVRMGMLGYSSQIVDKWGLTSDHAQAQAAVNSIGMVNENYDHYALRAAYNMITGNTSGGVSSGRQASALCGVDNPHSTTYFQHGQWWRFDMDSYIAAFGYPVNILRDNGVRWNWPPCDPASNVSVPPPQTARADGKPISKVKNVVFETDGYIMYEPAPCLPPVNGTPPNYGTGNCPNYPAFLAECQKLKDAGVTVFTISYTSPAQGDVGTLKSCASIDPATGQPRYFFAPGGDALKNIMRDIGVTIRKVRLAE